MKVDTNSNIDIQPEYPDVDDRVIIELNACASLEPSHSAQVMNYLRAANVQVGLLLNFGRSKLEYR
jgi:GxxExxY protein